MTCLRINGGSPGHWGDESGSSRRRPPMRSPLVALCGMATAGAALALPALPAAHAQTAWQTCSFNGRSEACLVAGGSTAFTVTFRSDGKRIEKLLITEPGNGCSTLAAYRQTSSSLLVRSERGNTYTIPS